MPWASDASRISKVLDLHLHTDEDADAWQQQG